MIFAWNKSLQKTGIPAYNKFNKSSAKQLVDNYLNILIRAVKVVDKEIIELEALEHSQRLKVYEDI